MSRSDALKKAQANYEARTKSYHFRCHPETDKDVIDKLESMDNKNGYIKQLIRADIEKQG